YCDIGCDRVCASVVAIGHQAVQDIASQIKAADEVEAITVVGYADRLGSESYNQRLSQERAEAVRNALVNAGLSAPMINAYGMGPADPLVQCDQGDQNALIACLAPNRRVEIQTR